MRRAGIGSDHGAKGGLRVSRRGIRHIALRSSLPEDALSSGARVTMMGRGSVLVEGQNGVIELSGGQIRLRTRDGVLCVQGKNLRLRELSSDAAMIAGDAIETATYAAGNRRTEG